MNTNQDNAAHSLLGKVLKNGWTVTEKIEYKGGFRNGLKALEYLTKESVDIVFLDIDMPHISGLALSKIIDPGIHVVFISAYSEFALESYEVSVTDYLLKPISFERFTMSIKKILTSQNHPEEKNGVHLVVKSGNKTFRILDSEIMFLKKEGNYINYVLSKKKVMARASIDQTLKALNSNFIQSHRSFIINVNKVNSYDRENIYIGDHILPLSDSFRESVLEKLEREI